MASGSSEIIILTGYSLNPGRVASMARRRGFVTRFLQFPKTQPDLSAYYRPILLIEIDGSADDVRRRITDLAGINPLHSYPLLVIGKDAGKFRDFVRNSFPSSASISSPINDTEFLSALQEIEARSSAGTQRTPTPVAKSASDARPLTPSRGDQERQPQRHILHSDSHFSLLRTRKLGGGELAKASRPTDLRGQSYLPEHPHLLEELRKAADRASTLSAAHVHRVSFTSSTILATFNLPNSVIQDSREAATILGITNMSLSPRLQRADLLLPDSLSAREALSGGLRERGIPLLQELGISSAIPILEAVAAILVKGEMQFNNDISLAANTLVAAEHLNRACWNIGAWNQHGAYRSFTRLMDGSFPIKRHEITHSLIKLLIETAEGNIPRKLVALELATNPALIALAAVPHSLELLPGEERVALSQLQPGMTLAHPLITFDGRTLADTGVLLDDDMIWRIWSLAVIHPINTPLITVRSSPGVEKS